MSSVNPEPPYLGDSRWRPRTNAVMCKHAGGYRRSQVLQTRPWPCTGLAEPGAARASDPSARSGRRGLTRLEGLLELVGLQTVPLGRGGVLVDTPSGVLGSWVLKRPKRAMAGCLVWSR